MIRDLWCRITQSCHRPEPETPPEAETLDLLHEHRKAALSEIKKLRKADADDIPHLLTERGNVFERDLFHEDGAS